MSILNNRIPKTLTASSGSASDTFSTQGLCHQIFVNPATVTTQYDVSITDSGNNVIFESTDEIGTMNELLTLPLIGSYTLSIANATVDEAFTVLIMVRNS